MSIGKTLNKLPPNQHSHQPNQMTGENITSGLSLYYIAAFQTMSKLNKIN